MSSDVSFPFSRNRILQSTDESDSILMASSPSQPCDPNDYNGYDEEEDEEEEEEEEEEVKEEKKKDVEREKLVDNHVENEEEKGDDVDADYNVESDSAYGKIP